MKEKILTVLATIGTLIGFSLPANAAPEFTAKQEVFRIEYDGSADELWFLSSSTWSSPSCPNATWVRILASVPGRKQILALGSAAQMAGKMVTFYGNCESNNTT